MELFVDQFVRVEKAVFILLTRGSKCVTANVLFLFSPQNRNELKQHSILIWTEWEGWGSTEVRAHLPLGECILAKLLSVLKIIPLVIVIYRHNFSTMFVLNKIIMCFPVQY